MVENYYGYPLEDREKDDDDEAKRPDQIKENSLKQISGKPLPKKKPDHPGKKF